jgi:hypothetical protein
MPTRQKVQQKPRNLAGIGLEFAALAPVFIGSSFRAAFLEPMEVGTFAKVLVKSVMPVFFCSPMWMAVLLPNVIGALTKDILQALHCAFQDVSIIPVRSQRPTPSNMHLSREGFRIAIGKERRVDGQLQRHTTPGHEYPRLVSGCRRRSNKSRDHLQPIAAQRRSARLIMLYQLPSGVLP